MKIKFTLAALALLCGCISVFAMNKKPGTSLCSTVPSATGPFIDAECPYSPTVPCCYLSTGSTSLFVRQTQGGSVVIIRKNPVSIVTVFGLLN